MRPRADPWNPGKQPTRQSELDAALSLEALGNGPLLAPDCRDGKHTSCVGEPCECECHKTLMEAVDA